MLNNHFVSERILPFKIEEYTSNDGSRKIGFQKTNESEGATSRSSDSTENYFLYDHNFYYWMYYTQTSDGYQNLYFTPSVQSSCPTSTEFGNTGDGGLDFGGGNGDFGGGGDIGGDYRGGGDSGGGDGGGGGGDYGDGGDGGDGGGGE